MKLTEIAKEYKGVCIQLGIGIGKYAIASFLDGTSLIDADKIIVHFSNDPISSALYFSAILDGGMAFTKGTSYLVNELSDNRFSFMNPSFTTCIEKVVLYDIPKAVKDSFQSEIPPNLHHL
jgi:hypothetical protein